MLLLHSAARCCSRQCRTRPPPVLLRRTFAVSPSIQLDSAPAPRAGSSRVQIPELQTSVALGTKSRYKRKTQQGNWQSGRGSQRPHGMNAEAAKAAPGPHGKGKSQIARQQQQAKRPSDVSSSVADLRAEVDSVLERGEMVGPVRPLVRDYASVRSRSS